MSENQHIKSVEFRDDGSIARIEFYESYITATELAAFIAEFMDARFPSEATYKQDNGKADTVAGAFLHK